MQDRYFFTLPPDISDTRFFKMLDLMRVEYLRRIRGGGGGDRIVRRVGGAVEFAGHQNYDPGDDLRYLDWHLLARLDNPYTKIFHEQEYYHVHLLLDASASMLGMQGGFKFRVAQDIATTLSYLILANDDRLRLVCFPGRGNESFRYAGRRFLIGQHQMPVVGRFLSQTRASGVSTFGEGFSRYLHHNRRHLNSLIIISDFLAEVPELVQGLSRFISANCHLVLIRIIDESERTFTIDRTQIKVRDIETEKERVLTLDESNRTQYEAAFAAHRSALMAFCRSHAIGYAEVNTMVPWHDSLRDDALLGRLQRLNILRPRQGK